MASARTCIPNRGFTLIEIVVVIGLTLMLIGLAAGIDLGGFFGDSFRAERAELVTVLQTARADALNNVDQLPRGVAIFPADHPQSYVLFAGNDYGTSDPGRRKAFDSSYHVSFSANSPSVIVFCQLSGDATRGIAAGTGCDDDANAFNGSITMTDPRGRTLSININHEGAISW